MFFSKMHLLPAGLKILSFRRPKVVFVSSTVLAIPPAGQCFPSEPLLFNVRQSRNSSFNFRSKLTLRASFLLSPIGFSKSEQQNRLKQHSQALYYQIFKFLHGLTWEIRDKTITVVYSKLGYPNQKMGYKSKNY